MTTFATNDPISTTEKLTLLQGQALRFLMAHRLGRLLTEDLLTGDAHVTPIHYVIDDAGAIVSLLPADSEHVRVLQRGSTASLLSIRGDRPARLAINGDQRIWHVQADVDVEIVTEPNMVRDILSRQLRTVIQDLPQQDKSDPLSRATRSELASLVGVRLKITNLRARIRPQTNIAA